MTKKNTCQRTVTSNVTLTISVSEDTCINQNLSEQQKRKSVKEVEKKQEGEKKESKVADKYISCRMTEAQKEMIHASVNRLDKPGTHRKVTLSRLLRAIAYALDNGDISKEKMLKYIERYT